MSRSAGELIEAEVLELVKSSALDPVGRRDEVARLVDQVLGSYETSGLGQPRVTDRAALRRRVIDRVAGLGELQPLMDDPAIEEIWINGPGKVFYARQGRRCLTNLVLSDDEIARLVERMLRSSGRRLDLSSPFVDATLADGSRLHVAIPDVTRKHWAVNIRKFVLRAHRLAELERLGSLPRELSMLLEAAVVAGLNILVSGATQSGKTTLLNCLAAAIPPGERVITCEEVFELQVGLPDVVALQTRQANLEGRGEITLRRLIVEALRMRPDRLIVGEVRQAEALDLLVALNSGLPGMTSIHANSAREALTKLATLPLLAGDNVTHAFVVPTVARSVDLVVHLGRDGTRRVVTEVVGVGGRVESETIEAATIWQRERTGGRWTGEPPPRLERLRDAGFRPPWL